MTATMTRPAPPPPPARREFVKLWQPCPFCRRLAVLVLGEVSIVCECQACGQAPTLEDVREITRRRAAALAAAAARTTSGAAP